MSIMIDQQELKEMKLNLQKLKLIKQLVVRYESNRIVIKTTKKLI
jgi:hypothetical protein